VRRGRGGGREGGRGRAKVGLVCIGKSHSFIFIHPHFTLYLMLTGWRKESSNRGCWVRWVGVVGALRR